MIDLSGAGDSGRYQMIEAIGQGGMGVVYRGLDTELNRPVAIKTIRTDRLPRRQATSRLRREVLAAAAIDHPYLCKVYDFVESQDGILAVMEFIEGRTLSQLLAESPPSQAEALRYCAEVCEALGAAHDQGLIHRDIKPSNIMVTTHGHVKVTDFGLAKRVEPEPTDATRLTQPGGLTGSPLYMSPELAAGDEVDQASDIFSLGAVLYRCLSGKHPFSGDSTRSYLRNLLTSDPMPLRQVNPSVPEPVERWVMACLQNDPKLRPSAAQLAIELARLAQNLKASNATRSAKPFPTRQILLAAAGLLMVATAVWLIRLSRAGPPWEGQPQPLQLALVTGPEEEVSSRISPDLQWVSYVTRRGHGEDRIWLKRIGADEARPISEKTLEITSLGWSPDAARIAYLSKDASGILLQIMPAYFGAPEMSRRLAEAPAFSYPSIVRWLPGGIYLALEGDRERDSEPRALWRYDPVNDTMQKVYAPDAGFDQIDISGDEKDVVFSATRDGRQDLWIASLRGPRITRLTDDPYSQDWPRWSDAEKRSVVFRSKRAGQTDIWQIAVDGGQVRQLTSSPAEEVIHDVALDGSVMTFKITQETSNIWQLDTRTLRQQQLTADSLLDAWPSVVPSQNRLAFQRSKPGNDPSSLSGRVFDARILIANRQDPNEPPRQIVPQGYWPTLSSDGSWLAYLVERPQPGRCAELWIKNVEDLTQQQVEPCFAKSDLDPYPLGWKADHLAWNPVQTEFAYCSEVDDLSLLKVCQASTANVACRTVAEARPGLRVTDLAYAPDGRSLAFIMEWPRGEGRRQLQLLDRQSGTIRVLLDDSQELLLKGWRNSGGSLIVLRRASFQSTRVEVLEIRTGGASRNLTTIEEASSPTNWSFDQDAEVLYLTRFDAMVHNLFALPLGTLRLRQLTNNALANFRFSGLRPIGGKTLYYAGQSITRDIWMIRFSE